jgi:ATP-binding cassette subfamily B (MDR/TAP) protein 1
LVQLALANPLYPIDEATSALDATSRILVFEAIKRWRHGKTTIVITHDLSQISSGDFIYVLKSGRVVEKGYRADLEVGGGEFSAMMKSQGATGGYLPEKDLEDPEKDAAKVQEILMDKEEREQERRRKRGTNGAAPLPMNKWMLQAIAELTREEEEEENAEKRGTKDLKGLVSPSAFASENDLDGHTLRRRPSSIHIPYLAPPSPAHTVAKRRLSLQFTPTSPTFSIHQPSANSSAMILVEDDEDFESEKRSLMSSGTLAADKRSMTSVKTRARWDGEKLEALNSVKVESREKEREKTDEEYSSQQGFWALLRDVYPTVPLKPLLFFGMLVCVISGAMTPVFSFLLSRLLFEVSIGATNVSIINQYGAIVLGVAAADGLLMGSKYFIMETSGILWVTRLRNICFRLLMAQDKKYFDKSANSPPKLVQVLIKDGDDARSLISIVIGQCLVVASMLGVGLVWALARGWQLTLVGFAIAPVFAGVMALQTNLVGKCELRNKRAREDVAKSYYESVSKIRGIRSMGFENVFKTQFEKASNFALATGIRGAFFEGCSYGIASSLIYLAEALLFYVGAVFIARGTYTYLQMVEVLNLVVFTVTIGSQLMSFSECPRRTLFCEARDLTISSPQPKRLLNLLRRRAISIISYSLALIRMSREETNDRQL